MVQNQIGGALSKMVQVTQFMSGSYDTNDYPYVLLNTQTEKVYGRFSTLEKAHRGRLLHAINNPDELVLLFNEKTKKFIDWRKKERIEFEKKKEE